MINKISNGFEPFLTAYKGPKTYFCAPSQMSPIAYSIRLTRQAVLCLGLLLALLVSGYQQAKCSTVHGFGLRASWVADEPAAQEILSLTDDEATTDRRTSPPRTRKAILEEKTALRQERAWAAETAEKDYAASLAAYAQQYARYILPPGYYLFLFRFTPF